MAVVKMVWPHRGGKASCAVCLKPLLFRDVVLAEGTVLRHEWCDGRAEKHEEAPGKPRLLPSGMILWQGKLYDPKFALEAEPGLTIEQVMEYAPH